MGTRRREGSRRRRSAQPRLGFPNQSSPKNQVPSGSHTAHTTTHTTGRPPPQRFRPPPPWQNLSLPLSETKREVTSRRPSGAARSGDRRRPSSTYVSGGGRRRLLNLLGSASRGGSETSAAIEERGTTKPPAGQPRDDGARERKGKLLGLRESRLGHGGRPTDRPATFTRPEDEGKRRPKPPARQTKAIKNKIRRPVANRPATDAAQLVPAAVSARTSAHSGRRPDHHERSLPRLEGGRQRRR